MRNKRPMGHGGHGGHSNGGRRFQRPGGGHRDNNSGGANRPRKNYAALREKYVNQARDALASGDRVLAENYYQHADHYYRMMAEEMERRGQWQQQNPQAEGQPGDAPQTPQNTFEMQDVQDGMDDVPAAGALPAFITQPIPQAAAAAAPVANNWEEEG